MIYNKKLNIELNKQGIQGAQGEQGIQGIQGPKGDTGATGPQGADGKNAIVMTSATTPNGEYNGQVGMYNGQFYTWNGSEWILSSGILPTDPVLHYSFDELPDIPNGTNNFTGVIEGASYTKEDIKGGYRFTLNGNDPYIHFRTNIGAVESLSLCYRQKAISKTGGTYTSEAYMFYTDSSYSSISGYIPIPTESENIVRTTIPCDKTKTVAYIRLDMFAGKGHSAVIEVTDMYIGDASYTTPVIDNAGNNHNATDVKGLATKGVSGKCLRSFSAINTGFTTKTLPLSANWSYSMWCNLESEKLLSKANEYDDYNSTHTGMATMLFGVTNAYNSYGIEILCNNMFSGIKTVAVNVFERNQNLSEQKFYTISPKVVDKGFVNITVSRDDSNTKVYCDGLFIGSFSKIKTDLEINKTIGINAAGFMGGNYQTRSTDFVIDDFQIFDRALSDQEVLGLYLARGNTPKRYTFADYQNSINGGKYHSTTKPAMAFEGDYYLNTTDGYIYSYDGTAWVKITNYNDARYKMAMTDMINLAATNPNVPFFFVTNAWIKNLAAGNILADEIATQTLELKDDGVIKSDNYVEGESGFIIESDGNVEFNKGRFRGGIGTELITSYNNTGYINKVCKLPFKMYDKDELKIFSVTIFAHTISPVNDSFPVGSFEICCSNIVSSSEYSIRANGYFYDKNLFEFKTYIDEDKIYKFEFTYINTEEKPRIRFLINIMEF